LPRNPAQDKRLSKGDILLLKKHHIDPEEVKSKMRGSDLFKDAAGNIYIKPHNGNGEGEDAGINLKALE